ncbi:FecR domain-containing protein [Sorangium sp. So ce385]|uniref:FecR domain-containing protein n=1 Tax=Sorangium sp. So ce385 TaxID=3133308 RepID=UPI003F5AF993
MGKSERSLIDLGRRVAALQDQAPEARLDHARGRARLGAAELRARPPTRPLAVRLSAISAAALLVVAIVAGVVMRPRPLQFTLGAGEPGAVGAWLAASSTAELPVRFSDGSWLLLAPGGRARVAAVDADGAEIALERGALDLSIVHSDHTRWSVRVGPFQVHVIGTRFETRWDPTTEQLVVALREGAITVSGPIVGDARAVRAGERLTISPAKGTLEVGALDEAPAPAPTAAVPSAPAPSAPPEVAVPDEAAPVVATPDVASPGPPTRAGEAAPPSPRVRASADVTAAPARPAAPDWRALALEAKYKDALAAAELEGFDAICAAASAHDLRVLGDVARLGGNPARAGQAFTSLRARFPGSPEAATAAFLLGRIAQDQSKDHAGAAGWFTRYLSERPGGENATEAAGRLIEAAHEMGDEAGARRAAERYLAAHPSGPHAAYARRVLARGGRATP